MLRVAVSYIPCKQPGCIVHWVELPRQSMFPGLSAARMRALAQAAVSAALPPVSAWRPVDGDSAHHRLCFTSNVSHETSP